MVWLVDKGSVDVLAARVDENGEPGARLPVNRIEAGRAIFGLDGKSNPRIVFFASVSPDAELRKLDRDNLTASGAPELQIGPLEMLVEKWVEALSFGVAEGRYPCPVTPLQAGERLAPEEEPVAAVSLSEVLWVKHVRGSSSFADIHSAGTVNGCFYFPLGRSGWLRVPPGSELLPVNTLLLFGQGLLWQSLENFHAVMTECLDWRRTELDARTGARLRSSAEYDLRRTRKALTQLGSTAAAEGVSGSFDDPVSPSSLLLACRIVGDKIGIEIKPAQEMVRGAHAANAVESVARASGVRVRCVILRGKWWKNDLGPMVAFLEDGSPVALHPGRGGYTLSNPATDSSKSVNATVAATLRPHAYVFFRAFPAKALDVVDILRFGVRLCRSEIVSIVLMGIAAGLLATITPVVTSVIFDSVIPGADRTRLLQVAILLLASAVSSSLLRLGQSFGTMRLETKMNLALQAAVWDRLLNLPVAFFRKFSSGDLAQRSMGINQIRQVLTGTTLSSLMSSLFSVFSFGLLFYYSARLAFIACVLVAVACVTTAAFGYVMMRQSRVLQASQGRLISIVLQFLNGISKLRVSGTENRAFAVWAREFGEQKRVAIRSRRMSNRMGLFNDAFPLVCSILLFAYGAGEAGEAHSLSTGQFIAFLAAFNQFMSSALQLSSSINSLVGIGPVYERSKPILESLPECHSAPAQSADLTGSIELNHISFRYQDDCPLVLNDVSLHVKPEEFVAVVGSSGSGKSTLLRILLGFEKPEAGAVYYDGQNLEGLDVQVVRRHIGVVLQSATLMNGNILRNISGSFDLPLETVWEAARLAGVDEDIRQMPMGMHTEISENGGGLSGGQRQRLLIARAIVRRPRILFFDEATSALDNRTQAIVSRSIETLAATRFVVAHRLSTIVNADRIFVLEKGRLVQTGTYSELISQEGSFRDLARRQLA
jgi:NHLM bacteriocin system ABC transporter ATP-binding protein